MESETQRYQRNLDALAKRKAEMIKEQNQKLQVSDDESGQIHSLRTGLYPEPASGRL